MRFLNKTMFRVMDTETTGTDKDAQVVEVAWADVRILDGKPLVTNQFTSLVDPGVPIPPEASAIHHITDGDVRGKPKLGKIMKEWEPRPMPGGKDPLSTVLVAHNAEFDSRFISWPQPWLCTMRMAKRLLDEQTTSSYSNQYLRYLLQIKPLHIGPLLGGAHRAAYDVAVTAGLLVHLLGAYGDVASPEDVAPSLDGFLEEMSQPIRQVVCHFGNKHRGELWAAVPFSYLEWMRKNVTDLDQDTQHTVDCEWKDRLGVKS